MVTRLDALKVAFRALNRCLKVRRHLLALNLTTGDGTIRTFTNWNILLHFPHSLQDRRSMDRNAHAKPPQQLREIYKHFQKLEQEALDPSHDILNFSKHDQNARNRFRADETEWSVNLNAAFQTFSGLDKLSLNGTAQNSAAPKVVECKQVPGKSPTTPP